MNFSLKALEYDSVSEPQAELAEGLFELSLDYLPDAVPALLDIGCGTGHLSLDLASLFPKSLDCLDKSKEMLAVCKDKLRANFPHVKWRLLEGDAEDFESAEKYDVIYSSATIQWFKDIPKFLLRVKKWLKPNGLFCLGAFGEKTLPELYNAYAEVSGRSIEPGAKFYSLEKLISMFKKSGFKLVDNAQCIFTQKFENSTVALKSLKDMGVTGTSKKPLNRKEIQKLKKILPLEFSWELMAVVFSNH